jgi:hypothetical protein
MQLIINLQDVSGGNPLLPALGVVAVAGTIITTLQACNKLGHDIGEWAYNKVNPNTNFGPMNYQAIPNSYYYHTW